MPEFWERQPGESAKAYYAFTLYRDLGAERSITKVSLLYNAQRKLRGLIGRWSSKYLWVQRAAAYDDYLDKLSREKKEKDVLQMQERHITISLALQQKAAERLKQIDGKQLNVRDMLRAIALGTKLERLARGEPTEQLGGLERIATLDIDWESIGEDERSQLITAARIIIETRRKERSERLH